MILTKIYVQHFTENMLALDELVKELREIFKEDDVVIDHVRSVMSAYDNNRNDWEIYAKFDKNSFTRNLVDEGNGKYNLLVLAWNPDQKTSIHDHSNSHCFMKILSGSMHEAKYDWPEGEKKEMKPKGTYTYEQNDVAYINDSMGLHEIKNNSSTEPAVTLHLYCPPYETCSTFDQATGERCAKRVRFWSIYGKEVPSPEN